MLGMRNTVGILTPAQSLRILLATLAATGALLYLLPERGSSAPSLNRSVWTQPLDTSSPLQKADFLEPTLAVGTDRVVFRSGGHICAFRITNGHRQWCTKPGDHPVLAGNRFAYITDDNAIEGVDAESGAHRWTFRFRFDPKATLPGARTFVWSFSDAFVAASYARTDPGHVPYAVVSTAGETRWTGRDQGAVHGPLVEPGPGRVLIPQQGAGAVLVTPWRLLRLEPRPSFGASFWSATAFLGRHRGLAFADSNSLAPMDERLTSFRVRIDDESGRTLENRRYHPPNLTPQNTPCATTCEGQAVAIDARFVYGRIHDVLYRFPWAKSDTETAAVSLGEATSFVGRASDGALIVTRATGTWLLDSRGNAVRSRMLSKENVVMLHRKFAEFDVLGFAGGYVVAIDARQDVIAKQSGCRLVDAARAESRLVLACGVPNARVETLVIQP